MEVGTFQFKTKWSLFCAQVESSCSMAIGDRSKMEKTSSSDVKLKTLGENRPIFSAQDRRCESVHVMSSMIKLAAFRFFAAPFFSRLQVLFKEGRHIRNGPDSFIDVTELIAI